MSRNRLMLLLAGVAAVVVAAGGFFLGVQPQLDRAATAKSDTESISAGNATTRAEIARLREQAKTLPEMRTRLATLRASVPDAADASSFITQLNGTADAAGVRVATITVGDATAYTPPAVAAEGTTGGESASSDGAATATATATATPTAEESTPAAPKTATDSSITAQNFSVIPVSVTVNGEFPEALAFVKGVQSNKRLFLIDSISSSSPSTVAVDSDAQAEEPSWTFSGSIYVLSDSASAASAKG